MYYFNKVLGHHQGLGLACATPWALLVLLVLRLWYMTAITVHRDAEDLSLKIHTAIVLV